MAPSTSTDTSTSLKSPKLRSILKRPTLLSVQPPSLSPFLFSASFAPAYLTSISPTSAMKEMDTAIIIKGADSAMLISPHVHFPPSPTLISMFGVAHSPDTYDRAPINVSPNPLEMPPWGDRVYSPTIDGFKLKLIVDEDSNAGICPSETVPFISLRSGSPCRPSPTTSEFEFGLLENPRPPKANILSPVPNTTTPKGSPKSTPISSLKPLRLTPPSPSNRPLPSPPHSHTKPNSLHRHPTIHFTDLPYLNPLHPHNPTTSLSKSLTSYPRSPYPSAPLGSSSPSSPTLGGPSTLVSPSDLEFDTSGSVLRQKAIGRRALSLNEKELSRRGGGRSRGSRRGGRGEVQLGVPAPVLVTVNSPLEQGGGFMPVPSPLRQESGVGGEDRDAVEGSKGIFEAGSKPTRVATGRKNLPPPLALNSSPTAFLATTTTTIVTTTTVQMTGADGTFTTSHSNNSSSNMNSNNNTWSTTSSSSPPPYSRNPIAETEIRLSFTPVASASDSTVGVGLPGKTSSGSPKSFVDENTYHFSQRQRQQNPESDCIENAKLTEAFWESVSLVGSGVREEASGMTSLCGGYLREERNEDEGRYVQPSCERGIRRWPGSSRTVSSSSSGFEEDGYEGSNDDDDDDDDDDVNESAGEDELSGNLGWETGRRRQEGRTSVARMGMSSSSSMEDFSRSLSHSTLGPFPSSIHSQAEQKDLKHGEGNDDDDDDDDDQVNIVFATRDGVLWSPGLPRHPHSYPQYYQPESITTATSKVPDDNNYDITYQGRGAWHQYQEGGVGVGKDENGSSHRRKEDQVTSLSSRLRPIEESELITLIQPPSPTNKLEIVGSKSGARGRNPSLRLIIGDTHGDVDEEGLPVEGLKSPGPGAGKSMRLVGTTNRFLNGSFRDVSGRASSIPTTKRMSRSVVASPSPNDPTAAFPSFSLVLSHHLEDGRLEGKAINNDPATGATKTGTITVSASTNTTTTINSTLQEGQEVPFSPPSLKYPPRARLSMVTGDGIQLKYRNTATSTSVNLE